MLFFGKAAPLIYSTLSGTVILSRESKPEKAFEPTYVMPSAISTFFMPSALLHGASANTAYSPIPPLPPIVSVFPSALYVTAELFTLFAMGKSNFLMPSATKAAASFAPLTERWVSSAVSLEES